MLLEIEVKTLTQNHNKYQLVEINFDMGELSQYARKYSFLSLPKINGKKGSVIINSKTYNS